MMLATLILALVALLITLFALSKGASPLGVAVLLLAVGEMLLSWSARGNLLH